MPEWIYNDDGGYYCSKCGLFIDDYYLTEKPKQCEKCGSQMSENTTLIVDRDYRLSRLGEIEYCEDAEYPKWLLDLRTAKAWNKRIKEID